MFYRNTFLDNYPLDKSFLDFAKKRKLSLKEKKRINYAFSLIKSLDLDRSFYSAYYVFFLSLEDCFPDKRISNIVYELKRILSYLNNKNIKKNQNFIKLILSDIDNIRSIVLFLINVSEKLFFKEVDEEYLSFVKEIAIPIAKKIAVLDLFLEIENNYFKLAYSKQYEDIKREVLPILKSGKRNFNYFYKEVLDLKKIFSDLSISKRIKSAHSIYIKLQNKKDYNYHDLFGIRIICDDVPQIYAIYGIILYKYDVQIVKDYVKCPKENGYKSLHIILSYKGTYIEVQIRTKKMHYNAEEGAYSHLKYKNMSYISYFDKKFAIMRKIFYVARNSNLLNNKDIFVKSNRILAFTPKMEYIELPRGSSTLDFAFSVHTRLGLYYSSAKVNGRTVSLDYKVSPSDIVEIKTSNIENIKKEWVNYVKTRKALKFICKRFNIDCYQNQDIKTKDKKILELFFHFNLKNLESFLFYISDMNFNKAFFEYTEDNKIKVSFVFSNIDEKIYFERKLKDNFKNIYF